MEKYKKLSLNYHQIPTLSTGSACQNGHPVLNNNCLLTGKFKKLNSFLSFFHLFQSVNTVGWHRVYKRVRIRSAITLTLICRVDYSILINWTSPFPFLAHLSRRLTRWAYRMGLEPASVRPCVRASVRPHFQTWISPRPAGRLQSNFIWSIIGVGERLH